VQVSVVKNGKIVVSAPAKLVENVKGAQPLSVTFTKVDGKMTVDEIVFSPKRSLVFIRFQNQDTTP
jgi:hypothetical protein